MIEFLGKAKPEHYAVNLLTNAVCTVAQARELLTGLHTYVTVNLSFLPKFTDAGGISIVEDCKIAVAADVEGIEGYLFEEERTRTVKKANKRGDETAEEVTETFTGTAVAYIGKLVRATGEPVTSMTIDVPMHESHREESLNEAGWTRLIGGDDIVEFGAALPEHQRDEYVAKLYGLIEKHTNICNRLIDMRQRVIADPAPIGTNQVRETAVAGLIAMAEGTTTLVTQADIDNQNHALAETRDRLTKMVSMLGTADFKLSIANAMRSEALKARLSSSVNLRDLIANSLPKIADQMFIA